MSSSLDMAFQLTCGTLQHSCPSSDFKFFENFHQEPSSHRLLNNYGSHNVWGSHGQRIVSGSFYFCSSSPEKSVFLVGLLWASRRCKYVLESEGVISDSPQGQSAPRDLHGPIRYGKPSQGALSVAESNRLCLHNVRLAQRPRPAKNRRASLLLLSSRLPLHSSLINAPLSA